METQGLLIVVTNHKRRVSVFISYVRSDNQATHYHTALQDHLHKNGIEEVWLDTLIRAGEEWETVIDERLAETTHLLLIWTPGAKESHYVTYEWSVAFLLGIQIILVFAPQYGSVRPDEIPDILRKFHLIQDPIAGQQDHGQLNKTFIEAERTDHCVTRFGLDCDTLLKLRRKNPADWQSATQEIDQWLHTYRPDSSKIDQVRWLVEHTVPPDATSEQQRLVRSLRRKLEELVDYPEKLAQGAAPSDKDEETEIAFRQSIQQMAKGLRAAGVPGTTIREQVKIAVAMWSKARYGTERPPEIALPRSKQFHKGKRHCGLCRLDDAEANEHGCCVDCGIFYTFWEPHAQDEA